MTDEDHHRHHQAQRRLAIAMADELAMQAQHTNFPKTSSTRGISSCRRG
jgi:hypothetical protein